MNIRHPSVNLRNSLHFVDLIFWQWNLRLEIGKKHKDDVDVLPDFEFRISSFGICLWRY